MQDARKLFRLAKWIQAYQKVVEYIGKPDPLWDTVDLALNIISRVFYGLYWLTDNLYILARLRVIRRNPSIFVVPLYAFWFTALFFLLTFCIKQLIKIMSLNKKLKASKQQNEETDIKIASLKEIMRKDIRVIIRVFADMVNAGSGCHLWGLFGLQFNDMTKGLAGTIAATLGCYELYK